MWRCYFLMRNGWMLHFLNLFHDKSFHQHWVSFKPWPSFKPCKIIYCIQVDYFLPEMVGTTSMLGFFFSNIGIIFIWDILYEPHIYHMKANLSSCTCIWLTCQLVWYGTFHVALLTLSSFQFWSFLKLLIFRQGMLK